MKIYALAFLKGLVPSAALLLLSGLLAVLSPVLGAVAMLFGSFALFLRSYRGEWPLKWYTCLLPGVLSVSVLLVQLIVLKVSISPLQLYIGAGVGVAVGVLRGALHAVFVKEGTIYAKRTFWILVIWFLCYLATQAAAIFKTLFFVKAGLTGVLFSTAMLVSFSITLFFRYVKAYDRKIEEENRKLRMKYRKNAAGTVASIILLLQLPLLYGQNFTNGTASSLGSYKGAPPISEDGRRFGKTVYLMKLNPKFEKFLNYRMKYWYYPYKDGSIKSIKSMRRKIISWSFTPGKVTVDWDKGTAVFEKWSFKATIEEQGKIRGVYKINQIDTHSITCYGTKGSVSYPYFFVNFFEISGRFLIHFDRSIQSFDLGKYSSTRNLPTMKACGVLGKYSNVVIKINDGKHRFDTLYINKPLLQIQSPYGNETFYTRPSEMLGTKNCIESVLYEIGEKNKRCLSVVFLIPQSTVGRPPAGYDLISELKGKSAQYKLEKTTGVERYKCVAVKALDSFTTYPPEYWGCSLLRKNAYLNIDWKRRFASLENFSLSPNTSSKNNDSFTTLTPGKVYFDNSRFKNIKGGRLKTSFRTNDSVFKWAPVTLRGKPAPVSWQAVPWKNGQILVRIYVRRELKQKTALNLPAGYDLIFKRTGASASSASSGPSSVSSVAGGEPNYLDASQEEWDKRLPFNSDGDSTDETISEIRSDLERKGLPERAVQAGVLAALTILLIGGTLQAATTAATAAAAAAANAAASMPSLVDPRDGLPLEADGDKVYWDDDKGWVDRSQAEVWIDELKEERRRHQEESDRVWADIQKSRDEYYRDREEQLKKDGWKWDDDSQEWTGGPQDALTEEDKKVDEFRKRAEYLEELELTLPEKEGDRIRETLKNIGWKDDGISRDEITDESLEKIRRLTKAAHNIESAHHDREMNDALLEADDMRNAEESSKAMSAIGYCAGMMAEAPLPTHGAITGFIYGATDDSHNGRLANAAIGAGGSYIGGSLSQLNPSGYVWNCGVGGVTAAGESYLRGESTENIKRNAMLGGAMGGFSAAAHSPTIRKIGEDLSVKVNNLFSKVGGTKGKTPNLEGGAHIPEPQRAGGGASPQEVHVKSGEPHHADIPEVKKAPRNGRAPEPDINIDPKAEKAALLEKLKGDGRRKLAMKEEAGELSKEMADKINRAGTEAVDEANLNAAPAAMDEFTKKTGVKVESVVVGDSGSSATSANRSILSDNDRTVIPELDTEDVKKYADSKYPHLPENQRYETAAEDLRSEYTKLHEKHTDDYLRKTYDVTTKDLDCNTYSGIGASNRAGGPQDTYGSGYTNVRQSVSGGGVRIKPDGRSVKIGGDGVVMADAMSKRGTDGVLFKDEFHDPRKMTNYDYKDAVHHQVEAANAIDPADASRPQVIQAAKSVDRASMALDKMGGNSMDGEIVSISKHIRQNPQRAGQILENHGLTREEFLRRSKDNLLSLEEKP